MKKILLISIIILFSAILNFAQPDWNPVVYTNSTTAYGIVTIDGSAAATGDLVGAFVGTECRAKGEVIINSGTAYVTLLIQGESVEEANFKIYDASADKIYDLTYTTNTNPGNTIGTPPDYLPLSATAPVVTDSLKVSPTNSNVGFENGTAQITVESNINWTVTEDESWLNVTPTSGSNNDSLTVTFDANPSTSERVGTITISGSGLTQDVTITQDGNQSTCDPNWEPVIYTNSTTAYGLVTIDGVAASTGDFVGVFVNAECRAVGEVIINNNNAYVTLLIQGESVETADFRIFDKSECQELFLDYSTQTNPGNTIGTPPNYLPLNYYSQSDSTLTVSPDSIYVNSDSGSVSIAITANVEWSVLEDEDWITVTPRNGNNDGSITISFSKNDSLVERVGYVRITGAGITRTITVTQGAASLPGIPILLSPENNAQIHDTVSTIEFTWTSTQFAETYTIEASLTNSFDTLVVSADGLTDTSMSYNEQLLPGNFFWRVRAENNAGASDWSETFAITIVTDINETVNIVPQEFTLHQNFPNPFNPTTVVKYGIPEQANVKIEIFNMLGQSVDILVNSEKSAGLYEANWNASNLPSGIYLISLKANGINSGQNFVQVKKALLLK